MSLKHIVKTYLNKCLYFEGLSPLLRATIQPTFCSLLLTRKYNNPSAECILEAIGITMTSNSTKFSNRSFTQIDGATIGSPDSGSITDIFGAVFLTRNLWKNAQGNQTTFSGIEMTQLMFVRTQLKRSSKK